MAKKFSKTSHLRSLFKRKIRRTIKSGREVPQDVIDFIESASFQTLNKYHKNRYREFNALLSRSETMVQQNSDPLNIQGRYDRLIEKGFISPKSTDEEKFYKDVIEYALKAPYGEIKERAMGTQSLENIRARTAMDLSAQDPEVFNEFFSKDFIKEEPNSTNTQYESTFVYDSILALIDEGVMGSDAEKFLANKLMDMLQEQIRYATDLCKGNISAGFDLAMKGINDADGWLIEKSEKFIFDSEGWREEAWKGSLIEMAYQIHGYIDDHLLEVVAELDKYNESISPD